ncbi:MAG: glycosyltransferase [Saprospiraceae bacterium]|nr:glycosyltransferase [Saprospiraceae bacterium]
MLYQFIVWLYARNLPSKPFTVSYLDEKRERTFPNVTIQLPIYNEKYVVERLIDCIVRLDYPKSKLEIQILDDSTDETTQLIGRKIATYREKGWNIYMLHREHREGFKAGALQEGLSAAKGDLIAIFDADFLPESNFLKNIIPFFDTAYVGAVQIRWSFANVNESFLTLMQSLHLNIHFGMEQPARDVADVNLQFNGSAAIWRKNAIDDSGGWQPDTLTEDLDLSLRAQAQKWKIIYLKNYTCRCDLASDFNGYRQQQFRWMQGGAQVARKFTFSSFWFKKMPFFRYLSSLPLLYGSSIFFVALVLTLLSVPMAFNKFIPWWFVQISIIFQFSIVIVFLNYYSANKTINRYSFPKLLMLFIPYLLFSFGMMFHNGIAAVKGWLGIKSEFSRTPKQLKSTHHNDNPSMTKNYVVRPRIGIVIFEFLLLIYFSAALYFDIIFSKGIWGIFHGFIALSYFMTIWMFVYYRQVGSKAIG